MSERAIQFYFQGQVQHVTQRSPTRTVLQYLREDCHSTGTKEGCAEGDCGACTVVVGELKTRNGQQELQLRAINSCIQFLPTLDGKALFTVEDIAHLQSGNDGKLTGLHPIQQAMVEEHASQCGFCTPGFVMSLWAMYENHPTCPSRAEVTEYLSGNLCRCTGYRPILDAAQVAYHAPRISMSRQPIINILNELEQRPSLVYDHQGQRFFAPKTRAELAQLRLQYPKARLLAGSTDVGLWVTKLGRDLGDVIYLGAVEDLKQMITTSESLEIGAMVSLTDAFAALVNMHDGWAELSRRFASKPIQNAGTLGGNVANGSPIGDAMPALIALNTAIVLQHGDTVRELSLDAFYLDYQKTALRDGEFVVAIRVPHIKPSQDEATSHHFNTYKISKRNEQDISAVCAAFSVYLDRNDDVQAVRIAYGGMAATPKRAMFCESELIGKRWNSETINSAMQALQQDFSPLSDGRASSEYRQKVAANLLKRFWLGTMQDPVKPVEDSWSNRAPLAAMSSIRRLSDLITTVDID